MLRRFRLLSGAALSAGLMYLSDPRRGQRRRAVMRDTVSSLAHRTGGVVDVTSRDVRNRAAGRVARIRSWIARRAPSDHEIAERIRRKLRAVACQAGALRIRVDGGRVMLSGPVLAGEVERIVSRVAAIRGVKGVENHLAIHETWDTLRQPPTKPVPRRRRPRLTLMPVVWSPTTRLAAGMSGSALVAYAARRFDLVGAALAVVGVGLLARGLGNRELGRLVALVIGRGAINIQKMVDVAAPVREVFEFWTRYDNWPRVMPHVREVREIALDRHRWVIAGPAGVPIEWITVITKFGTNRVIEWETVPTSAVKHSGSIRFRENRNGTTRVDIKMSYVPPAGAVGHAVAALFGADPKTVMNEGLARFKSLLEHGPEARARPIVP